MIPGFRSLALLLGLLLVAGCAGGGSGSGPAAGEAGSGSTSTGERIRLVVFVGSASQPPTTEAKEAFEAMHPNITVDVTFGGSGTLLNQMTLEETGDLYMPGSDDYMDKAEAQGAIVPETSAIVAYLVPSICVRSGNPKNIQSLADMGRAEVTVGLAEAGAVCLGDISNEVLRSAGVEEQVKANCITYARSCSQTQQLVQLGEVDAIVGWDAFKSWAPEEIDIVPIAPEHLRVRNIPIAVSVYAEQREAAQEFIDFITSQEGKDIFARHGYSVTPPEIR